MLTNEVAIVVIGRNEGKRLIACLASLCHETDKVVYVDSGSTDGSIAAAKDTGAFVVQLDMAQAFTAARARNEGFVAARKLWPGIRYIQFVDGDCELVPGWLQAALKFIEQRNDVAIVCGRRRERYPNRSIYNRLCDLEWATPVGEAIACGGDSLVRVSAFEMSGGFQPKLIAGEEPEMCLRLRAGGWTIWRLDAEMTTHDAAMTRFTQWWVRAIRSGYGYAQVIRLHRHSAHGLWRREARSAIFWSGSLPLIVVGGCLLSPTLFVFTLIYPIQICRMAFKRAPTSRLAWVSSMFVMLSQFAAFAGIVKFHWNRLRNRRIRLIEYKSVG